MSCDEFFDFRQLFQGAIYFQAVGKEQALTECQVSRKFFQKVCIAALG